jgi:hypothetical protein
MSYRKTRLIQERNILLERKYILEQAPPGPLSPSPTSTGATPSPPQTPVTPPPPSTSGTTNEIKKFTKEEIKKVPSCSNFQGITDNPKYEKKEQEIDGVIHVYYLTEKQDMIFSKTEPR